MVITGPLGTLNMVAPYQRASAPTTISSAVVSVLPPVIQARPPNGFDLTSQLPVGVGKKMGKMTILCQFGIKLNQFHGILLMRQSFLRRL